MSQIGNKQNSSLNGQLGKHGRPDGKKVASKKRRKQARKVINDQITNLLNPHDRLL